MIYEFSFTNFLSFKEKNTFSMIGSSSDILPDNYITINNKKILKTAVIYGANASGKSNVFKILNIVIFMLRNSNNFDINKELPIIPYKFDEKTINEPSEFEIKILLDNVRYVYGFKADKSKIYEEYLYYYPNGREAKIFDRTNVKEYSFPQLDQRKLNSIVKMNADNKFFLATATNWNFEKTRPVYEFLTNSIGTCFNIEELKNTALAAYETHNEEIKKFALEFLEKTDFNIADYRIDKVDVPPEFLAAIPDFFKNGLGNNPKAYQILLKHKNSDVLISLDEESLGTQVIFCLIPFLFDSLNKQKVLIIDELDRSLHPLLAEYIVEMFNNPEINKNSSQLIFNTQDTNLLNLDFLRRDQIWFTEKDNESGTSDLYCLSDFEIRKNENVEKGYILGRYGAIPFIRMDLNLWEDE